MYVHDIHVLYYFFIGLLGIFVGQFLDYANSRLANHKKIFCKELFKQYIPNLKINSKIIYPMAIIYVALLYFYGWQIKLLEYLILTPMFLSAFIIDYRKQIIPNRLNLAIFEVGLIFAFIYGLGNFHILLDKLIGLCIGGGIFLIITLIGGLIAGKEAMGFGDVKLMASLGLIFGSMNIVIISVLAFLIGAIISIILLITKIKKTDEYIPFGPFIIISVFCVMFIPTSWLIFALLKIFTLGMYKEEI